MRRIVLAVLTVLSVTAIFLAGMSTGAKQTYDLLASKVQPVPPSGQVNLGEGVCVTDEQFLVLMGHECRRQCEGCPPEVPDTYTAMLKRPVVELLAAQQVNPRTDLPNGWKEALKRVILLVQTDPEYIKRHTGKDATPLPADVKLVNK